MKDWDAAYERGWADCLKAVMDSLRKSGKKTAKRKKQAPRKKA